MTEQMLNGEGHTPGPWSVWEGPLYVGGGADLCIGAGEEWLANMDHRQPRCAQILENGHDDEACDICTIDSGHITDEQRANAALIAAAPDMLAALRACEENLRLIHEAAGPVPKWAPMPSHSTFGAWEKARDAIAKAVATPTPEKDQFVTVTERGTDGE